MTKNLRRFRFLVATPAPAVPQAPTGSVQIVDECGTAYLRALARRITPEAGADYVISTVRRAKGLEWKRVKVTNDFRFKMVDGRMTLDDDEMRLLYVAVTRAQHVLDISGLRADHSLGRRH